MNVEAFLATLPLLLKGMGGIFAAIIVIMLAVMVLGKVTGKKDKEE